MEKKDVEDAIIGAMIVSLEAQAGALRRLRRGAKAPVKRIRVGMSHVDLAQDILERAGKPLHVEDIIERIKKVHERPIDRESLVSALSKKVARADRFVRTGRNTFALKGGAGC